MKKLFIVLVMLIAIAFIVTNKAQANILLFSDTFNGTTIDTTKWTLEQGYGSISQNNEAIFNMVGNNNGNSGVHLKSKNITVPTNTEEVVFSGQWRVGAGTYTAASDIYVYDANDITKYVRVGYGTWNDNLEFADSVSPISGADATLYRDHNLTMLPFEFHFNNTGWTYSENGTILKNFTSNFTDNIDDFFVKIGGWDYSQVADQNAYFDNININARVATPEPASMTLLGMGLFGLLGFRKRGGTKK